METKELCISGQHLKDSIDEIEAMIHTYEDDIACKSDIESPLCSSEYEALKTAVNCMKSIWYVKQAMGLAYDEEE